MKHLLYVLKLKDSSAFKVGITNSINFDMPDRVKNLHKIYNFDLTESYLIEMKSEKLCRTLEKQLHNDYKEFQYVFESKTDGHTEFLKIDCFEDVLIDIKHKERLKHLGLNIRKGIEITTNTSNSVDMMSKYIREIREHSDIHKYLVNHDLFLYLFKMRDCLSFAKNVLVIKSDDVKNITFDLMNFHDNFNKKNRENTFKLFEGCVGQDGIAIMKIFEHDGKNTIQHKKMDNILDFLNKHILVCSDIDEVLDMFDVIKTEIVVEQWRKLNAGEI
jgi:hypothetical protein